MSTQSSSIPQRIYKDSSLWTTGMALFSMFFGAGNLIFPLIVGLNAGTETSSAIAGLTFSAVLFPFLGLVAMLLYNGDLRAFLARLGPIPAFILLFILHASQGPVASLPRLVTLMHASAIPYFPNLSLGLFSVLICFVVFLLAIRPQRIVHLLGSVLTPLLLLTLAILVAAGLYLGEVPLAPELGASHHFTEGLKGGYQTMDLTAALLFATIVIPHLRRGTESLSSEDANRKIRRKMMGSSIIAAALLMVTYIGLSLLASHQSSAIASLPPEAMLQAIAVRVLGPSGGFIAAAAVFLACLTTALSLAVVFAEYMRVDLLRQKVGPIGSLVITLGVTAVMANLGFSGLRQIIGPTMQILYPSLIVLCLTNICYSLYQVRPIKVPVYAALGLGLFGFCFA